jgi:isochorismate synthase
VRVRAVTVRLDAARAATVDLDAVAGSNGFLFVRDGVGVAGRGIAARVPAAEIAVFLATIESDDLVGLPGWGPIAFGVLPFPGGDPAVFLVPQVSVTRTADGNVWVTTVRSDAHADVVAADRRIHSSATHDRRSPTDADFGTEADAVVGRDNDARSNVNGDSWAGTVDPDWDSVADALSMPPAPVAQGGSFSVGPGVSIETYLAAVATGRDAVRTGKLDKVVIARDLLVTADRPLDVGAIMHRLRSSYGSSYRYLIDGFLGASPELLVERQGDIVRAQPLAGTTPRTGDPETDARLAAELLASMKNQIEHRVVIDVVNDTLLPWCSYLDWETEPSILAVANVQHLSTRMEGRLSRPLPTVWQMADALSPTPALGGHPRAEALALIAEVEGMDRGPYGGAVGWIDAAGNGTFAVAIRCAQITGSSARLFAGGGIVAESDPRAELAETQAKFQAMLNAIIRP